MSRDFHRPMLPGAELFEAQADRHDPAELAAAGHRVATLLVRGPRDAADQEMVDRVLHLADAEGLGTVAELWSHAPSDTVAGCLWRLYLLRDWVHRQPELAAREFAAGKVHAPVREALAGVIDPPSPQDMVTLVDIVVRGIVGDHFDVTLDRAGAFAHIIGVGRAQLDSGDPHSAARLVDMAAQLHRAAAIERDSGLP